jgi:hypothetical protein
MESRTYCEAGRVLALGTAVAVEHEPSVADRVVDADKRYGTHMFDGVYAAAIVLDEQVAVVERQPVLRDRREAVRVPAAKRAQVDDVPLVGVVVGERDVEGDVVVGPVIDRHEPVGTGAACERIVSRAGQVVVAGITEQGGMAAEVGDGIITGTTVNGCLCGGGDGQPIVTAFPVDGDVCPRNSEVDVVVAFAQIECERRRFRGCNLLQTVSPSGLGVCLAKRDALNELHI